MKICAHCKQTLAKQAFYKNATRSDGLTSECKACVKARQRRYQDNVAADNATSESKVCSGCKKLLQSSDFHKSRRVVGGLAAYCKTCMKDVCARLRVTRNKATARWKSEHPTEQYAISRRYYLANKETRLAGSAYRQRKNPGAAANRTAVRRRMQSRAVPPWADVEWIVFLYDQCSALSKLGVRGKFHVDHIVPINSKLVCGLHTQGNLQVIPAKTNQEKSNKTWPDMP